MQHKTASALAGLVALFAAWAAAAGAEQAVLTLHPQQDEYRLAPHAYLLKDADKALTIQDVSAPERAGEFLPVHSRSLNLGVSDAAYWIRFTLKDDRPRSGILQSLVLDLSWENLDSVRLFIPRAGEAGFRMLETGGRYQRPNSPLRGMRPVIALDTEDNTTATYYLRIEHEGALFLPLHIRSVENFLALNWSRAAINGFYVGMLFSIAMYNFLLFLALRQRVYLFYVGYVLFGMLYYLSKINVLEEMLFAGMPEVDVRVRLSCLSLAALCCFLFARDFLFTSAHAPRLDLVLRGWAVLWAVFACLVPVLPVNFMDISTSLLGIVTPLVCVAVGLRRYWQGFAPSRYFIVAWGMLSVAYALWSLMHLGLMPAEEYIPWTVQGVSGFEIVLLSFALSHRVRVLREEKEAAGQRERRYRELAITDELTGLYNVRFFRTQLPLEVQRAEKLGLPLSLALLDIDDFKRFNDTQGHPAGDAALRQAGAIILQSVRERDVACRYGGEEFVILFPATTAEEAVEAADRIRLSYAQARRAAGMPHYGATLSVGMAQLLPNESPEALVERADRALYQAKNSGKNRVILAPARPPRPRSGRKHS
jgi:diguanylate cyclase (GGDEF)-like protein